MVMLAATGKLADLAEQKGALTDDEIHGALGFTDGTRERSDCPLHQQRTVWLNHETVTRQRAIKACEQTHDQLLKGIRKQVSKANSDFEVAKKNCRTRFKESNAFCFCCSSDQKGTHAHTLAERAHAHTRTRAHARTRAHTHPRTRARTLTRVHAQGSSGLAMEPSVHFKSGCTRNASASLARRCEQPRAGKPSITASSARLADRRIP